MTEHDPLQRQLPTEPRFPLLARDVRAEVLVTVWAYLRERKWDQAQTALAAGIERLKGEPSDPHKDKTHAASARQVATKMHLWRRYEMSAEEPKGRVNTTVGTET